MALIHVQEFSEQAGNFHAKVSFNQGPAYNVILSDPFSKGEEERLEWYFEERLNFPFTDQVKSQEAAISVIQYGERLFKQVFANEPHILTAYKKVVEVGLNTLQIEIVGQPSFHALHWEALKDPELPQPLALQATIVRQSGVSQAIPTTVHSSPTINLLIVVARPLGRKDLGYRTISRPLVESLRQDKLPVKIDILRPGTYKALENHLRVMTEQHGVGYYHVVHFDVHGSLMTYDSIPSWIRNQRYGRDKLQPYEGMKAFLFLEGEKGNNLDPFLEGTFIFGEKGNNLDPLEATELAHLLRVHQIPIAILNACQSGKQVGDRETSLGSHLVQAGVQMVVAMGYSVTLSAAKLLMHTLYQHLLAKESLAVAMRHGRTALYNHKTRWASLNQTIELEDWMLPVVYQNQEHILQVRAFTPEESAAFDRRAATSYAPPQPRYGFVGRDHDILQIEKYLLTERNMFLVQGMGGTGITTLLQHLGEWWQRTGFVKRVFYFAYDERDWTRGQILDTIARQLLSDLEYARDFQLKPLVSQQKLLVQKLRAERHLLIFDNLEAIIRAQLATKEALQSLLVDLKDGQSLALLGSRSKESWLTRESWLFEALDEHVYQREGLEREAEFELTGLVLERHNATKYREDPELWHLIKLLHGLPLALEVVLANLEQRTPTEILAALQTGSVDLDTHNSRERTKSILGSIDYSYSKLNPDAQKLLLCLAPFTTVADVKVLKGYIDMLQQQPALSTFPFEYWSEMLQEAIDLGLLIRPIPGVPRILFMLPTLPYFLRRRLDTPERTTMRDTLKDAFRRSYEGYGKTLTNLLKGRGKRRGEDLAINLEYENLMTALKLALASQNSVQNIYFALSEYLYQNDDMERASALDQMVWKQLETYPQEKRVGELGEEYINVVRTIAERQLDLRHYEEADKTYHELLDMIEHLEHFDDIWRNTLKAQFYNQLGRLAQEQGQWSQAEKFYKQALQIKVNLDDRREQAVTYHQLGQLAEYQGQWAQAEAYYRQALPIFFDFKSGSYFAATSFNLGTMALKQHNWPQAEAYYKQAWQIYVDFNDHLKQAMVYGGLGHLAQEQEQWVQAEAYYKRALAINMAHGVPNMLLQVITYHHLGHLAQEQRQWEQAERYCQQGLQISIEFNDRHWQANMYHQLGNLAQEQRQWEQAERYYQQALQIRIEFNDRHAQAIIYGLLGKMAQEQRHWMQAEENYQKALQIFIEFNDRHRQALTYPNLGTIALKQHNWPQARTYYLTALKISVEEKDDVTSKALLRALASEWRGNNDITVLTKVAEILGMKLDEARQVFAEILANEGDEENKQND